MRKADAARAAAYADHYLKRFQDEHSRLKALLDNAARQLAIAERQHAAGEMVTGTEDGIPDSVRGLLGTKLQQRRPRG